jgi:hypothetical protein
MVVMAFELGFIYLKLVPVGAVPFSEKESNT